MANPTTNFGWVMPTSTDLVTDLPADFAVFGQGVDTSFADLNGGTTGQVLSKASNTNLDFAWVAQDDSNAIQNAIVDAKGDLIAATAADTPARLAVGTNGQVLTADSTAATGLAWVTSSPGSYTSLATGTLSGSSVVLSSISGSYQKLILVVNSWQATVLDNFCLRINADTASNYAYAAIVNYQTAVRATAGNTYIPIDVPLTETSANNNVAIFEFPDYATTKQHSILATGAGLSSGTKYTSFTTAMHNEATAITSLTLFPLSGSWSAGNYVLYGVK